MVNIEALPVVKTANLVFYKPYLKIHALLEIVKEEPIISVIFEKPIVCRQDKKKDIAILLAVIVTVHGIFERLFVRSNEK